MARPCPVCQSADTGGYPQTRLYSAHGPVQVDDWVCHSCGTRWEHWDYSRIERVEHKNIRLKDGREWTAEGGVQGEVPVCPYCRSPQIKFVQSDGRSTHRMADVHRYECEACAVVWQWYIDNDGKKLFKRRWRY
jgi:transposase-like protein